jgi:GH25 family lysozyme M1 (1,4-beta-N-acetylmuramidase)
MPLARNIALVALITCLPIGLLGPRAGASTSAPAITHPEDDWAGSQIAHYEGAPSTDPADPATAGRPAGFDVSHYQGSLKWPAVTAAGAKFAYIKATEGVGFVDPNFTANYNGAYRAGIVRGAYHFATPNTSDGRTQANYFLAHGGGWTADGRTLPPAVDLEYNPYGSTCYGMTPAALVAWVHAFVNQLRARTGRWPTIYTSTRWWAMCMGDNNGFGADPLWIARYNTVLGALPPGWTTQAIWQFADTGPLPGDQDAFNGTAAALHTLAVG